MLQTELGTRTKELSENVHLLNQQVSEEHSAEGTRDIAPSKIVFSNQLKVFIFYFWFALF